VRRQNAGRRNDEAPLVLSATSFELTKVLSFEPLLSLSDSSPFAEAYERVIFHNIFHFFFFMQKLFIFSLNLSSSDLSCLTLREFVS
jgi:hypothetical protein